MLNAVQIAFIHYCKFQMALTESNAKRHYTYFNRSDDKRSVRGAEGYDILGFPRDAIIFECDADNILEADKKFEAATKLNIVKQTDIWLSFQDLS